MEEDTRVIRLQGEGDVSFEQAFGEFSEFRGKGRKRRAKRRQSRRMDRINARAERKRARRKMRTEASEDRASRRMSRKASRLEKRGMGKESEEESTDSNEAESDAPEGESSESSSSSETGSSENTTQQSEPRTNTSEGYSGGGQYYNEGAEEESEEDGEEGAEEESEDSEDSGFDGFKVTDVKMCGFDASKDNFEEFFSLDGDDFFNLQGNNGEDIEFNQAEFANGAEDYYSSADGSPAAINPSLQKASDKLEWNREFVSRLKKKCKCVPMTKQQQAETIALIKSLQKKQAELLSTIQEYSNFSSRKFGRKNSNAEISKARKRSLLKRFRSTGEGKLRMSPEEALKRSVMRRRKMSKNMDIPVAETLGASFSKNRIDVPAEDSSFNGTGLNGLDNVADYDAPDTRVYDIEFSGVAGEPSSALKKAVPVILGVLVAGILIYAISKYKKK